MSRRKFGARDDFDRAYRRHKIGMVLIFVLFLAIFIGSFFLDVIIVRSTRTTVTATVTDKDIKRDKNTDEDKKADDIYMIYAEDSFGNTYVFTDEDELWYWKWDSSDVYAKIKVGKTYEFEVCGIRIPFLSSYQNIIDVTEVE